MKQNKIFSLLLFLQVIVTMCTTLTAQTDAPADSSSKEYWRKAGYEARLEGKPEISRELYLKVLQIDEHDWDANLAVARLYFNKEDYKESLKYYNVIFSGDTTDVEALWGMGRCYFRTGKFEKAVMFYRKANSYLSGHVPLMFDLAYALTNNNQLKEAISVYDSILSVDSLNVSAWAGAGKLYYWLGRPVKSSYYYKKALQIEPQNSEYIEQYDRVRSELALSVNYQFHYINESEPVALGSDTKAYNIDALMQRIVINKRAGDRFLLTFSALLDHSDREYSWQEKESRWFDNTYLKLTYLAGNNRIGIHGGYSISDSIFSTYGIAWEISGRFKNLKISNTLSAGYDYYYYWNKVGHDYASDYLRFEYKNLILEGVYRFANVRELYLLDTDAPGRNPGHLYTVSLRYNLFKNPKISVGLYHQFRDYKYRSPLYWSPQDRKLNGANIGIYWKISEKMYFYSYGNIGKDNYDIEHWEASAELGYTLKAFSITAGAYRFYNPWYESFNANISLTKRFQGK